LEKIKEGERKYCLDICICTTVEFDCLAFRFNVTSRFKDYFVYNVACRAYACGLHFARIDNRAGQYSENSHSVQLDQIHGAMPQNRGRKGRRAGGFEIGSGKT
jgi:hypothetical protein